MRCGSLSNGKHQASPWAGQDERPRPSPTPLRECTLAKLEWLERRYGGSIVIDFASAQRSGTGARACDLCTRHGARVKGWPPASPGAPAAQEKSALAR
jgi:hypothetical protein